MQLTPFHLAIPVRDIDESRKFYGNVLGLREGRSAELWVDYDFFGHQLVIHENHGIGKSGKVDLYHNPVDDHAVPIPHFGVVLEMPQWQVLADRMQEFGVDFVIEPYIRFKGEPGEQATMFFLDPSGNALEFKAFKDIAGQLFAK